MTLFMPITHGCILMVKIIPETPKRVRGKAHPAATSGALFSTFDSEAT